MLAICCEFELKFLNIHLQLSLKNIFEYNENKTSLRSFLWAHSPWLFLFRVKSIILFIACPCNSNAYASQAMRSYIDNLLQVGNQM